MRSFISKILSRGLNKDMTNLILDMRFGSLQAAFTTKEYDQVYNYEFFEQMGDLSINKFIVNYMAKRFPQLRSSNGVGVLATIRIKYASKEELAQISEKLGFDKFIKCTEEELLDKNKYMSILEDVFEAFFGAIEYSIDELYYQGLGYIAVYKILSSIFDEMEFKIDYESLVDAKTRLNEIKAEYKLNVKYTDRRMENGVYFIEIYIDGKLAGKGSSNIKKNGQIKASQEALYWIEHNLKIKKKIPERFRILDKHVW